MKAFTREAAFEIWDRWWNDLQEEWIRIEVLQDYSGEDNNESLKSWMKGDKQRALELLPEVSQDWAKICQQSPQIRKTRFHVVKTPFTSYLEWEMEHYKRVNIPLCGEKVSLVHAKDVKDLGIIPDLAIFDQKRVAEIKFTENGKVTEMNFYERGEDDIEKFTKLIKPLKKRSRSVEESHV